MELNATTRLFLSHLQVNQGEVKVKAIHHCADTWCDTSLHLKWLTKPFKVADIRGKKAQETRSNSVPNICYSVKVPPLSHTFIHGILFPAVSVSCFLTTSQPAGMGPQSHLLNWNVYPLSMGDPSADQHLWRHDAKNKIPADHLYTHIYNLFMWQGYVYICFLLHSHISWHKKAVE